VASAYEFGAAIQMNQIIGGCTQIKKTNKAKEAGNRRCKQLETQDHDCHGTLAHIHSLPSAK
jgi:hypothetical protein